MGGLLSPLIAHHENNCQCIQTRVRTRADSHSPLILQHEVVELPHTDLHKSRRQRGRRGTRVSDSSPWLLMFLMAMEDWTHIYSSLEASWIRLFIMTSWLLFIACCKHQSLNHHKIVSINGNRAGWRWEKHGSRFQLAQIPAKENQQSSHCNNNDIISNFWDQLHKSFSSIKLY